MDGDAVELRGDDLVHVNEAFVDLGAVRSKYIGETEKNLARLLHAVELGGVVLVFDEADALFGRRTEAEKGDD